MVRQVKGGYLLRYKKRLLGKSWREEWVVLYEDSTLAWCREPGAVAGGGVQVAEAPELAAAAQWTQRIPGRPPLPPGCSPRQLMAFGTRRRDAVHWLLAQSEDEVNDWMTAISNTLPPAAAKAKNPLDPLAPRLPPVTAYFDPYPVGVRGGSGGGGDLSTGIMMGAMLTNWGHGWGWASHPHTTLDVSYIGDDYGDLGFDDADYGMDCGGDFGF